MIRNSTLLAVALALVACSSSMAQTGIPPFSSTTGGPDVVNLGNLNVHFAVPIVHKPGRGIPFDYDMSYDSTIWSPVTSGSQKTWQPVVNWGWRGETEAAIGYVPVSTIQLPCIHPLGQTTYYTAYLSAGFIDRFGVFHLAPVQVNNSGGTGCPEVTTATAATKDGSGYSLTLLLAGPSATVTSQAGAVEHPPIQSTGAGNVTDRNGNQLTTTGTSFTDTLATTALSITGGAPSPLNLTYNDTAGNPHSVVMNYGTYTVQTNFNCSGVHEYGPTSVSLVSSISLPDGSSYQFTYETTPGFPSSVTGRVASIQLRTGGTISYVYTGGAAGITCADGTTAGLTRTTPDGQWTYSRANPSGTAWTTTMQSPTTDKTVINFQQSGSNFFETLRQVYQGPSTLLATVYTCYNAAAPDCSGQAITLPITEKAVYTNLNGSENKVDTFYNGSFTGSGLPSEIDEYDFGSNAPGALLRKTVVSYASLGNNIFDKVSSVTVQDGGGAQRALTNYYYDQTGLTASGAPQHVSISGSRGNLTEISQWLNTTGAYFNTTLAYDDAGNVLSSTDPLGHPTSFQYSNSDAYLSLITLPQTGNPAVNHTLQATYDSNTGLATTTTDQNQQITRYSYDTMLRPSTINYPDGGSASFTYASPTSVETKRAIDASRVIDQTTILDGLGRPSQTQLVDPEGNDTSETTYDGDGRVFTVTNPHRGTASATDGTTTFSYDALNRMTKVTKPDGAFTQSNFVGNTVTNTDEAGKQRETNSDGIGRLTTVIEPNPASGSLTSGDYSTTYSYNTFSSTITQSGDGTGNRVRTFTFDSLSRMISEAVPESGNTTFGYDSDGNLNSITDARSITTTIGYDALNRPTIKSYSDGETSREFMYDQANHGYSIGRLTHASNDVNSAYDPSYDVMGRVTSESYCIPSDCSYTKQTIATYDLAGDLTSLIYPDGRKIVDTFSVTSALTKVNYDSFSGTGVNYAYYTVPQGSPGTPSSWGYWPAGGLQQFSFGPGVSENLSANSRLMMNQITANAASQTALSKTYGFVNPNNGDIASITDNLNSGRTQNFGYDYLNRLTSANTAAVTGPDAWSENFTIDPWGNMKQSGSYSFNPASFDTSNRISQTGYSYDAAGNLLTDTFHTYAYDAEERMKSVDSTAATYTYGPDGERARKDLSGGTFTEYVYFGGQVIAEKSSAGDWTDYIFANGQRVAKAEALDDRLHIYGTKNVSTQWVVEYFANAAGLANYTIRSGDKIFLTQYQNTGSKGGMVLNFTNGTNSSWSVKDKEGYYLNDDHSQAVTHFRTIDLSSLAGKIISKVGLDQETDTVIGTWGIMYEQISLVSTDGTVFPIYTGQTTTPINSVAQSGGETGIGSQIDVNRNLATSPTLTTTYYVTDHLGSSRLLMSGNGYPIWSGVFLPYGQEWNPQITMNTYKFTGDEHDAEANLEHTWFRQYEGTQGRWLTPDPAGIAAVNLSNPQTLNRYTYVGNGASNYSDPLGLVCSGDAGQRDTPCNPANSGGGGGSGGGSPFGDLDPWQIGSLLPPIPIYGWVPVDPSTQGLVGPDSQGVVFQPTAYWGIVGSVPDYFGGALLSLQGDQISGPGNGPWIGAANNGTHQQPTKTQERLERLKNCALGYYGIDPLSATGLASDASKWLLAGGPGVPKAAAEAVGVRVIAPEGASSFTSLARIGSILSGGALQPVAAFAKEFGGPIAIASAVIDATAIGICTAMD